jgi:DNA (cytosine-5)-methyltransferase 1
MTSIEMFAGGGGAADGIRAAGLQSLMAVDLEPSAVASLEAAGHPAFRGDVEVASVLDEAQQRVSSAGGLDLLWASPPCPLYSKANTQARSRAYDGWGSTLRWAEALRPRVIIVENVSGAPFLEWSSALQGLGFSTSLSVLNASWYGVPQRRVRGFLIGIRGARAAAPPMTEGQGPASTMGDALPHLALRPLDGRCPVTGEIVYPQGFGRAGTEPDRLWMPSPTVMTTEVKGTRASASSGWDFHGGPDRASDAAFLAVGRRRLAPWECAILQGFPRERVFFGSVEQRYRQIGNAVPPALAGHVSRYAMSFI